MLRRCANNAKNDFNMVASKHPDWRRYLGLAKPVGKGAMGIDKKYCLCYNVFIGGNRATEFARNRVLRN